MSEIEGLKRDARLGHAKAQNKLGAAYMRGEGVPRDAGEGIKWFKRAAEQGMVAAQHNLAIFYQQGTEGLVKDEAEAAKWYRLAAEQGDADAQCGLANLLLFGKGVPQDEAQAIKWLRVSAESGSAEGQGCLSIASSIVRQLAEGGNADAQFCLGKLYQAGMGHDMTQDYQQAVNWLKLSAEQGDAGAQSLLGFMYVEGDGVLQNHAEGVIWLRLAATQGEEVAIYRLGRMYAKGDGVPQDREEAVKWLVPVLERIRGAADEGDEEACWSLDYLVQAGLKVDRRLRSDEVFVHFNFDLGLEAAGPNCSGFSVCVEIDGDGSLSIGSHNFYVTNDNDLEQVKQTCHKDGVAWLSRTLPPYFKMDPVKAHRFVEDLVPHLEDYCAGAVKFGDSEAQIKPLLSNVAKKAAGAIEEMLSGEIDLGEDEETDDRVSGFLDNLKRTKKIAPEWIMCAIIYYIEFSEYPSAITTPGLVRVGLEDYLAQLGARSLGDLMADYEIATNDVFLLAIEIYLEAAAQDQLIRGKILSIVDYLMVLNEHGESTS